MRSTGTARGCSSLPISTGLLGKGRARRDGFSRWASRKAEYSRTRLRRMRRSKEPDNYHAVPAIKDTADHYALVADPDPNARAQPANNAAPAAPPSTVRPAARIRSLFTGTPPTVPAILPVTITYRDKKVRRKRTGSGQRS